MNLEKLNELLLNFGLYAKIEGQEIYFVNYDTNTRMDTRYKIRQDSGEQKRTSNIGELLSGRYFYVSSEKVLYRLSINYDKQNDIFRLNELVKDNREYIEDPNGVYLEYYGESGKKYKEIYNGRTTLDIRYNNENSINRLFLKMYDKEKEAGLVIASGPIETQVYYSDNYSIENEEFIQNVFDMYIKNETKETNLEYSSVDFHYVCEVNHLVGDVMKLFAPELLQMCSEAKLNNGSIKK